MDQANRLRGLIRQRSGGSPRRTGRVVAVASGKGGVGKSVVSLNLAAALAGRGRRVALVDADLGLGSLDLLCGMSAEWNLSHVLSGAKQLHEILIEGPAGLKLAAGASGRTDLADGFPQFRARLLDEIADLAGRFDEVILDTPAGLHEPTRAFAAASSVAIVVTAPEPTSLADAYALVKALAGTARRVLALVNMADGREQADRVVDRLSATAAAFVGAAVRDAGFVPFDSAVRRSVTNRTPFVLAEPRSPAAKAVGRLADRLIQEALLSGAASPFAAGSPTAAAA
jgi:flagellar biosynthesis protein FlhG